MDTVISHRSALLYLDRLARCERRDTRPYMLAPVAVKDLADAVAPYRCERLAQRLALPEPLDVVVGRAEQVRHSRHSKVHLWSRDLPPWALAAIDDGVLVSTAPFVFLQMASHLSVVQGVKLANYMLGTFSYSKASEDGIVNRRPLVGIGQLEEIAQAHGSRKIISMARWAVPCAASPMEAALAAMLFLPSSYGGFGLPKPSMNHPVPLSDEARKLYDVRTCYIDLYWPEARFGLEFDSRAHHAEAARYGSDQARALALRSMGIGVMSVTALQMRRPDQLDEIAKAVAEATGSEALIDGRGGDRASLLGELL